MTRISLITLGVSMVAMAQSPELDRCMGIARTQYEMTKCAGEEMSRLDAQRDALYQQVLRAAQGNPRALAKIKTAERGWHSYRAAYMDAMYPENGKQANYGSTYPMNAALAAADLTRAHVKALKTLLRQHAAFN